MVNLQTMKLTKTVNLIFFGPQGSGKGTQAKLLAEKFGLKHLSSGEALRATAKTNTPLGRYLKKQLATGTLTPVPKLLQVFERYIAAIPARQGIIFDGFARQISETRLFLRKLKKMGRRVDLTVMIDLTDQEAVSRLSKRLQCNACNRIYIASHKLVAGGKCPACGGTLIRRPDDEPDAIRKRLRLYRKRTLPVIGFFKQQGILERINGAQPIVSVRRDILRVLEKRGLVR